MRSPPRRVNNEVYRSLGERWYEADDDPIALLRALTRLHAPWIGLRLRDSFGDRPCRVLDLGCGAGLLANELARRGHDVVGVDIAEECLRVAAAHDATGRVRYVCGDATALPFAEGAFDAVCAMDFLEHVEDRSGLLAETARVLAPRGLFLFHTFTRNLASWLLVIKGVAWFVRNAPPDLHVLRLFITPGELRAACAAHGLAMRDVLGCEPRPSRSLVRLVRTGRISDDFAFRFSRRVLAGYTGFAERTGPPIDPRSGARGAPSAEGFRGDDMGP